MCLLAAHLLQCRNSSHLHPGSGFLLSTQLNGFNYCYLTLIILFNINHLFAYSEVVSSIAI